MATIQKLYLHAAATPLAGTLPAATVSATAPTVNGLSTAGNRNRKADATPGAAQASTTLATSATTTAQKDAIASFLGAVLAAQTIAAGNWTINAAISESNTNANVALAVVIAVWRPSTGALVGRIFDGPTAGTIVGAALAATGETNRTATVAGAAVTCQDGDILVIELWNDATQAMATSYTATAFYDGTTDSSITTAASFVQAPNALTLFVASDAGSATATATATVSAETVADGDAVVGLVGVGGAETVADGDASVGLAAVAGGETVVDQAADQLTVSGSGVESGGGANPSDAGTVTATGTPTAGETVADTATAIAAGTAAGTEAAVDATTAAVSATPSGGETTQDQGAATATATPAAAETVVDGQAATAAATPAGGASTLDAGALAATIQAAGAGAQLEQAIAVLAAAISATETINDAAADSLLVTPSGPPTGTSDTGTALLQVGATGTSLISELAAAAVLASIAGQETLADAALQLAIVLIQAGETIADNGVATATATATTSIPPSPFGRPTGTTVCKPPITAGLDTIRPAGAITRAGRPTGSVTHV